MSDLIDRQAAIDALDKDPMGGLNYNRILNNLPSAQKTGKWIVHTEIENVYGGIYIECSECGESYLVQHLDAEMFCRTCGSKNGV